MRFRNNLVYVQRQIDLILREYRKFARVYVDNIVIFNKILKEHVEHLVKIFKLFKRMNIFIKPNKIYLGYSFVALLEQKMNNLKLITTKKKLEAIFKLRFSITLKLLKWYLELTRWIRNYVLYYAQLLNSLQIRKILMLCDSSSKGIARKRFNLDIRLNIFFEVKLQTYRSLQEIFSKSIFLVHHDRIRQLYVDVDASHEREFGAIVFYVKDDKTIFSKKDIEFILFLSRMLTSIESRYWSIELKIARLI